MAGLQQYMLPIGDRFSWIDTFIGKMGSQEFCNYYDKVCAALERLKPGHHYNIANDVPQDQQEIFVKCCHLYSLSHPEYDFNIDVTKIVHYLPQKS